MKIAIVSDSHDNIPNIDKMLAYCKKAGIELMLHCGDVCAPSVLRYLAENFKDNIYLVYGNVDGDHRTMEKFGEEFSNLNILGETGEVEIPASAAGRDGKKIYLVHYPNQAKEIAQTGKYDLVFYGHNHKPWEEKIGNTRLVNPGTLAGLFQKATFAVYDTESDNLELIILEKI